MERLEDAVSRSDDRPELIRVGGVVTSSGLGACEIGGLSRVAKLGDFVSIGRDGDILAQITANSGHHVRAKPLIARSSSPTVGSVATLVTSLAIWPHAGWRGRVIDALGSPVDGSAPLQKGQRRMLIDTAPPLALERARVRRPILTGIRVVDLFTPLSAGQRMGIFAGSGVGKSTLLGMLARSPGFDTIVVALVGERGREVREFMEETLGDRRRDTITVVATGDEPALLRRMAPLTATAVAEYHRDRGDDVLLLVDSVTRFAHASREIALAAGEPAVARGYAPSVFADLPRLLERAGAGSEGGGTITGIYTVLVDGDDVNDPVADSIRGTLDGHVVLARGIADQGRYPPVDLLSSLSRLASSVWTREQHQLVVSLRALIARYEETRDLRAMGAYNPGRDPELDRATHLVPKLYRFLAQTPLDPPSGSPFDDLARELSRELS